MDTGETGFDDVSFAENAGRGDIAQFFRDVMAADSARSGEFLRAKASVVSQSSVDRVAVCRHRRRGVG